jgi:hypothetical protein
MLGAKLASFVGLAEVVFAIGIAWLLLGQLPTAVQLGGGALIVAGIALVRLDELRTPAAVHTPPGIDPPLVTNPPTASSAPLLTATRPPQDQLG